MEYLFPIYRKYANNKVFFKVNSFEEFEERTVGTKSVSKITVKVNIHPDRVRITDMLENHGGYWVESSENEWNAISEP
jgi:hypothetical protein